MAFIHGKNTELWLGGADLSGFFNSLDFSAEVETAETTTFKKNWKTHIVGIAGSTLEMGGLYDPTMTNVRDTLSVTTGNVLTVGAGGLLTVGDLARLALVSTTSYAESSPVGDVVAFSWSVLADGQVGIGNTLHPLAARTATANGTGFDSGVVGGTATGAIAHLHITAISGASASLTVTIQDSADGSSWANVASGAFSAATAVGAQRLVIPGTIRRHTRAIWTISGTTPSITFGVALART